MLTIHSINILQLFKLVDTETLKIWDNFFFKKGDFGPIVPPPPGQQNAQNFFGSERHRMTLIWNIFRFMHLVLPQTILVCLVCLFHTFETPQTSRLKLRIYADFDINLSKSLKSCKSSILIIFFIGT